MNKRKITMLLALAVAGAIALLCIACNEKPSPGTLPGGDDDEPEQFVVSLSYDGEYKSVYYEGEAFDPTGLVVTATWYDDDVEILTSRDYTIEPSGALAVGTTSVRLTYEDNHVDVPVTVNEIIPLDLIVSNIPDMTQYYGTEIPFGDISVTALLDGNETVELDNGAFIVELDGSGIDGSIVPERGVHTLSVRYKTIEKNSDLVVIDGVRIEAESMIQTADITETNKNFVEVDKEYESVKGESVSKPNRDLEAVSSSVASNGAYMGGIFADTKVLFHVWAEKSGKATLILRAASGKATASVNPDTGKLNWGSPIEMSSLNFAESTIVRVKASSADDFTALTIDSRITLPGGVAVDENGKFNASGDPNLWVNWFDVVFGEYDFEAGDNVVEITFKQKMNIDRFEVRYISDGHTHDGRGMLHTAKIEPTCMSAGVKEYYTCALCGEMFADILGTQELYELMLGKSAHSYAIVANDDYKRDYYEFERFDTSTLTVTGVCEVCGTETDITDQVSVATSMTTDTREVRIGWGDKFLMLPVNVTPIVPAYIEISGLPEQTQYYGTPVSLGGLQVTAVTDGGQRFILDPDAYTVKLDGEAITDGYQPESDIHVMEISFKDKSERFDFVVIDGTRIEAENIIETAKIKESDRNFVEKTDGQVFESVKHNNASDGAYMGSAKNGAVIVFHVWADKAGKATLILRASSAKVTTPAKNPSTGASLWAYPIEMASLNFASSATVRIKTSGADDFTAFAIDNRITLPGGVALNDDGTFNENGNKDLYVNWFDVVFGEYELAVGDNIIEVSLKQSMNIDRLEIRYLPEVHTHNGRGMVHHDEVAATCRSKGVREYYTCGLCGKMYADELGTEQIFTIMTEQRSHNYSDGKCTMCGQADPAAATADYGLNDVILPSSDNGAGKRAEE